MENIDGCSFGTFFNKFGVDDDVFGVGSKKCVGKSAEGCEDKSDKCVEVPIGRQWAELSRKVSKIRKVPVCPKKITIRIN